MATPKRPYIPWKIRWKVAQRQLKAGLLPDVAAQLIVQIELAFDSYSHRVDAALRGLGFIKPQLDHDPALTLRKYRRGLQKWTDLGLNNAARYTPNANDPNHLIYRESDPERNDHLQKTTGRKAGAERTVTTKGSDIGLKAKFDRLEGRTKKRPKQKIRSRGFPKPKERRSRW